MVNDVALHVALSEFGLSEVCKKRLSDLAKELREFEAHEKDKLPTKSQRIKSLKALEVHALAIRHALDEIGTGDFLWLDIMLGGTGTLEDVPSADGFEGKFGSRVIYMQRMACNLAVAARNAANEVNGGELNTKSGGRKNVLDHYAGFIVGIAIAVKDARIKAGRGGSFERICCVIFTCAGVHANPEGAIRNYLEKLAPEYQRRRLVFTDAVEETAPEHDRNNPV